jgi:16S rRNA (guanine966-N2)-methyltransferase
MHIIAGKFKGRKLQVPASGVRPMADRAKTIVFQILENHDALAGAEVLDLFGGSGALSIEAVSRGAEHSQILELSPATIRFIQRNTQASPSNFRIQQADAERFTRKKADQPYDLIFLDPPFDYPSKKVDLILENLLEKGYLAEESFLVIERRKNSLPLHFPEGLELLQEKLLGDIQIYLLTNVPSN